MTRAARMSPPATADATSSALRGRPSLWNMFSPIDQTSTLFGSTSRRVPPDAAARSIFTSVPAHAISDGDAPVRNKKRSAVPCLMNCVRRKKPLPHPSCCFFSCPKNWSSSQRPPALPLGRDRVADKQRPRVRPSASAYCEPSGGNETDKRQEIQGGLRRAAWSNRRAIVIIAQALHSSTGPWRRSPWAASPFMYGCLAAALRRHNTHCANAARPVALRPANRDVSTRRGQRPDRMQPAVSPPLAPCAISLSRRRSGARVKTSCRAGRPARRVSASRPALRYLKKSAAPRITARRLRRAASHGHHWIPSRRSKRCALSAVCGAAARVGRGAGGGHL